MAWCLQSFKREVTFYIYKTVLHLLHMSEMATHNSLILGQLYSTIFIPFRHTWLSSYTLTFDNENINIEVDTLEFLSCERFMVFIFIQMLPQKGDVLMHSPSKIHSGRYRWSTSAALIVLLHSDFTIPNHFSSRGQLDEEFASLT